MPLFILPANAAIEGAIANNAKMHKRKSDFIVVNLVAVTSVGWALTSKLAEVLSWVGFFLVYLMGAILPL